MAGSDSEELLVRLKRIIELSEKLLAMKIWNEETRNLTHLISHEMALAQRQIQLYRPAKN